MGESRNWILSRKKNVELIKKNEKSEKQMQIEKEIASAERERKKGGDII